MRLKRKRKKNHSRFHLESLGYASASRTHAVASRPNWTRSPRRESCPRQNDVTTSEAAKPAAPVEAKLFVAVPPAPRPDPANASPVDARDARVRGCTSVNAWRAS